MFTSVMMTVISYGICAFVLPESPGWLLINGRKKEAIEAFNFIGRINGAKKIIPVTAHFCEANDPDNEHAQNTIDEYER